jgi:hypothetical protein
MMPLSIMPARLSIMPARLSIVPARLSIMPARLSIMPARLKLFLHVANGILSLTPWVDSSSNKHEEGLALQRTDDEVT